MEKREPTQRAAKQIAQGGPVGAVAFLSQFSSHDGHVFDVGVNKGTVARHIIRIFPDSPSHLFEPLPEPAEQLKSRFEDFDNLTVVECALSNKTGTADFNVGANLGTSSLFDSKSDDVARNHPEAVEVQKTLKVKLNTVDAYCKKAGIERINCMKLDVQGAELLVLKGARKMIAEQAIDIIMLEWFAVPHYDDAPLLVDTWQYLADRNYSMYDIFPGRRVAETRQRRFGDAVFISDRFRRENLDAIAFGDEA